VTLFITLLLSSLFSRRWRGLLVRVERSVRPGYLAFFFPIQQQPQCFRSTDRLPRIHKSTSHLFFFSFLPLWKPQVIPVQWQPEGLSGTLCHSTEGCQERRKRWPVQQDPLPLPPAPPVSQDCRTGPEVRWDRGRDTRNTHKRGRDGVQPLMTYHQDTMTSLH